MQTRWWKDEDYSKKRWRKFRSWSKQTEIMKLQDILQQYHQDSAHSSDIDRNLNYALLGVIWILARENVDNLANYMWPLALIVLSLSSDFLQYFVKALLEKRHFDSQEKKATNEESQINEEYDAAPYPLYIKKTAQFFYYLKLCLTVSAVIIIIVQMAKIF